MAETFVEFRVMLGDIETPIRTFKTEKAAKEFVDSWRTVGAYDPPPKRTHRTLRVERLDIKRKVVYEEPTQGKLL